ncbi:MAG TPA: glutamate mutase L [Roseiflexaceae bacterium]
MPQQSGATLVAEIGNVTTRVTLVDLVDGEARLIGQAVVPSTTEPPYENAVIGILEAATQLSETTSRQLMRDGSLLMPQTSERDGVNGVHAVTSASPPMGVVIAAVASEVSARSALHASRATYTTILQTITLDDAAGISAGGDSSWIERQVQTLMSLNPDLVLIAGGLEDGAQDSLARLAHIVGLTALSSRVDADGQQRQDIAKRKVIFAGNSQARDRVLHALSERADLVMVDNVRPTLEVERLEPARQALAKLYNETLLPAVPGTSALRRISEAPVAAACDATGLITRFIAARYARATLTLDSGSANTAAYLDGQGRYSPAIYGGVGTGYGIGGVLAERGIVAIARWLPFPISVPDLTHCLLNKMLRPQTLPTTREDVLIEHAVAREALALAIGALRDERGDVACDNVVACGGVLANAPHRGLAVLTVLDALQPAMGESSPRVDLYLDTLGLIGVCGALAFTAPEDALTVFDRDLMRVAPVGVHTPEAPREVRPTPLATCVVALGSGRLGELAVEAELRVTGGDKQVLAVLHGQIGRLPLPPGKTGTLTLRPAGGVRIGRNAPGDPVSSDPADVTGSDLGVIIDARGRPLRLPDEPLARQKLLWDWLVALGVESGPLPYAAAEPLPDVSALAPLSNGNITFDDQIVSPAPAADFETAPVIERDLAKLRQTIEEPKKRGFFRRR